MARTTETPRSLDLGLLLVKYRKRAKLSQLALAAQLGRSHSDVSRYENGKQGMDEATLGAILGVLGVTGAELDEARELHSRISDPNWLALGVGRQLAVVREYEDSADQIVNVQPQLIPGPLQTRPYALIVMRAAGASTGEAQTGADFRMARGTKILSGDVEYEAIISEFALRYPACGMEEAPDQLRHLLKVADLPNVTIRTTEMAAGYSPMRQGSFVLIESAKSVVHLEQLGGSSTLADSRYVREYKNAADIIRREAMSPASTTELIAQLIDEMERTT
jgi:transcriptional regulator with XRE-family HTH domain